MVWMQHDEVRLARVARRQPIVKVRRLEHEQHHPAPVWLDGLADAGGLADARVTAVAADQIIATEFFLADPVTMTNRDGNSGIALVNGFSRPPISHLHVRNLTS